MSVIEGGNLRATLVGFAGAVLVLAALLGFVGVGKVVGSLSQAALPGLALVLVVATAWLSAWGLSLRTVLSVLGAPVTAPVAVLVFASAIFANNVTPFGQAGGEPVSALFVSQAADTEYETGLAAIASVDALNFVPSIALALVGLGYFATQITFGRNLALAAAVVGGLAVAIPIAAYVGWQRRYRVEEITVSALTPAVQGLGRAIPGREPPPATALQERVESFFRAVERVAASPHGLATALGFSAVGWISLSSSLWLSLFALGYSVTPAAVLVAVPAGAVAGVAPLPGGLGGVEAVLAALLVPTAGVAPATAVAAVALHRAATYWLPTVVGGGVAAALAGR
ncbi:TIGR00374 family protein [Halobacteriales archaeon QS_4_69_34]|nr:MAG: TIGR00374 family protein [Halobacteriales archaeon QS_4_69_34]